MKKSVKQLGYVQSNTDKTFDLISDEIVFNSFNKPLHAYCIRLLSQKTLVRMCSPLPKSVTSCVIFCAIFMTWPKINAFFMTIVAGTVN